MSENKPLFRNLDANDPDPETTEIESLCMNCGENGMTRLLLTKIPFYKDVVIISFNCENCGYQNNEIQSGGPIAEKGIRINLKIRNQDELNRQVVKSDYTSIKIPEIDFEIPAQSQKGEVTTIEGIIDRTIEGLSQDQPVRKITHPDTAQQIEEFIQKVKQLKQVSSPFTMIFEDISGNIFIQNLRAPMNDNSLEISSFTRTKEQNHELGIFSHQEVTDESCKKALLKPISEDEYSLEKIEGELMQFATNCPDCGSPCETNMKMTNIPHFKEVVIMATNCETCGHRSNEVKSGSGIEPKGIKISVKVSTRDDFSRDVLKSETCSLSIPELELEVGSAGLGGRFTTIEGLLTAMKQQLVNNGIMFDDSSDTEARKRFDDFLSRFDKVLDSTFPITLILEDPAGNSYVQSLKDTNELDKNLTIVSYERTYENNEELGLNDIKTENY